MSLIPESCVRNVVAPNDSSANSELKCYSLMISVQQETIAALNRSSCFLWNWKKRAQRAASYIHEVESFGKGFHPGTAQDVQSLQLVIWGQRHTQRWHAWDCGLKAASGDGKTLYTARRATASWWWRLQQSYQLDCSVLLKFKPNRCRMPNGHLGLWLPGLWLLWWGHGYCCSEDHSCFSEGYSCSRGVVDFRVCPGRLTVTNWGDIAVRKPCTPRTHTNQMIFRCLPVHQIMFSVSFFKSSLHFINILLAGECVAIARSWCCWWWG